MRLAARRLVPRAERIVRPRDGLSRTAPALIRFNLLTQKKANLAKQQKRQVAAPTHHRALITPMLTPPRSPTPQPRV